MTTFCPHCHKRLLSLASVNCNWCGQPVADADFQARAQTERDAYFAHQSDRDALSLARADAIDPFSAAVALDPFTSFPLPSRRTNQNDLLRAELKAQAAAQEALTEEKREADERAQWEAKCAVDEAAKQTENAKPGARFRHLEL